MVEGARLESVCRGNSTVGSNPTLSANLFVALFLSISHETNESRILSATPFILRRNAERFSGFLRPKSTE